MSDKQQPLDKYSEPQEIQRQKGLTNIYSQSGARQSVADQSRENCKNALTNFCESLRRGIEKQALPSNREIYFAMKNLHEMISMACYDAWQEGFNDGVAQERTGYANGEEIL